MAIVVWFVFNHLHQNMKDILVIKVISKKYFILSLACQFGWYKIKAFFMWIAATVAAFIDVLI